MLFRPIVFSLALLLIGASCADAAQVVALGASNTEGKGRGRTPDGVPRAQAYPAQLERMLNAQGCRVHVLNAGKAGDTTGGMLARLPGVIAKDTKVVVFQAGGNDARQGVAGDSAANIAAIRNIVSAHGAKLVTMGNVGSIAGPYLLPDRQHFSVEGHVAFASSVLAEVRGALGC
jgi:acyl-CoA thioesterase-1